MISINKRLQFAYFMTQTKDQSSELQISKAMYLLGSIMSTLIRIALY
uniref:Uncharacterized protein n=2 Tax=Anguilla anguilla TaxID=7936 RepID=A0A0E9VHJ8_ANGAN